jgi:hypothetical protein
MKWNACIWGRRVNGQKTDRRTWGENKPFSARTIQNACHNPILRCLFASFYPPPLIFIFIWCLCGVITGVLVPVPFHETRERTFQDWSKWILNPAGFVWTIEIFRQTSRHPCPIFNPRKLQSAGMKTVKSESLNIQPLSKIALLREMLTHSLARPKYEGCPESNASISVTPEPCKCRWPMCACI